jgi:KDO2-lipid IV(A) lauroyltransferase
VRGEETGGAPLRALGDLLERGAVAVARAAIALLARLPHALVLAVCRLAADVAFALHVRRRIALRNLDLVYGERMSRREKRRVARSALRNLFMTVAEMARGSHPRARAEVAGMLEFEPRALVDDFAADPRGSLFAVAHCGNFDLCGLRFTHDYGRPLAVVMKPLGTPRFSEFLIEARHGYGFRVLSTAGGGVVERAAECLRDGGLVCILPDQFARRSGVVVDFLGVPASTHAGAALAALRAQGCRIFAAVDTRVHDGARHVCHVREILGFQPSGDLDADVLALTTRLCDAMGEIVRDHPESYLWQHRRWRARKTDAQRRERAERRRGRAATTAS